jgi:class 3 adenylate cyclase/tetratricopeptide (TPR) repeat protein
VICTNCATENAPGRKFCANCGTRLAVVCPNCGAANAPADRFCGECGTALDAEATAAEAGRGGPAPRPTMEGGPVDAVSTGSAERRLVTILFADLVGFTSLSESRDAEDVRELQARYFTTARDVIARYGGTVEKFIGDAVMAVWGAPLAHEDDAERAVRAALELVDAVRAIDAPGGADGRLHVRAGVLTGEAAVTVGAVGQGMVTGDLVNTASRLQSVAPADTVLVGEATQRSTRDAITFEEVGEQSLKGKVAPVPAWRAVQVVAMRGGGGRSERLEAPFVGRDAELRLLKDMLHATTRERRLRLVSVTGIGGIGKSRLAWEFLKYVDGLVEDVYWHQGRSPAYGEGVTFWALGEMVRRRARIAETDDDPTSREKLAAALTEFVPEEADRRWIGPRLEALLGLAEAPTGEREETFAAWRAFFERVAALGPTVLVFEELHWADAGLLDFIESMLEWSRNQPILIVTLARPELLERRPTWGAGQRNFVALALEPLGEAAMRELLAGLAPGLPDPVVRRILRRAEGVPLYAVETVRMLVDGGLLVEEDGRYTVAGDVSRLAVPETLKALIAARIDGLEPAERALLQDAAILGQAFTLAGLSALTGRAEAELEPLLRALVRKEVLVLDADPRSPERGQYGFVQGLIREVAHETISKRERRAKHLAAARYLETIGDEELAAALASHYLQAYEATPPGAEAEALAAQARVALRAAADRAAALYSHEQALALLEQAESVTIDPTERVALWERMADAARAVARYDLTERLIGQALEWHQQQGDVVAVARDTARLGDVLLRAGSVEKAIERLNSVSRDGLPAREVGRLASMLGRAYMLHNEFARALVELDQALIAAGEAGDSETVAEALASKGPSIGELGRFDEAVAILHGAIALAESHGHVSSRLRASFNLAGRVIVDDPAAAFRVLREALELSRRLGQRIWFLPLAGFCIGVALDVGEWDWAMDLAAEVFQGDVPPSDRLDIAVWLAYLHAARGHPEEAEALLTELTPIRDQMDSPGQKVIWWWTRSNVDYIAGRYEDAYQAGITAVALVPDTEELSAGLAAAAAVMLGDAERLASSSKVLTRSHRPGRYLAAVRGEYQAALTAFEGQRVEATRSYADVIRRFADLGHPSGAAIATTEAALLVGVEDPAIRGAVDETRAFFLRVGAVGLLERLHEALARGPIAPEGRPGVVTPERRSAARVATSPRP